MFQRFWSKVTTMFQDPKQGLCECPHICAGLSDDENATLFLRDNFRPEVSARFENLTDGAHKADLFRYAFLYVNGGVWLDADVEMREPMESIFDRSNTIYTAESGVFDDVFQAILASPPRIEFLNDLVEEIVASDLNGHGLPFTVWFKDRLLKSTGIDSLKVGRVLKSVNGPDFYLFEESCSKERSEICPALDKYGLCCWVMDRKKRLFKARYDDYPFR